MESGPCLDDKDGTSRKSGGLDEGEKVGGPGGVLKLRISQDTLFWRTQLIATLTPPRNPYC